MELCFVLFLFHVHFVGLLAKLEYNTFPDTTSSVVTIFQPYVTSKDCLLKPDPGPCRAKIKMFYFNSSITNCTSFSWGGCQGNGNRFDKRHLCLRNCLSQPDAKKESQPRYCSLSFDYGFCFGALERWYYDQIWKVCKKTIYSGCGGNKNNFYSLEQCEQVCRFGKAAFSIKKKDRSGLKKVLIIDPDSATSPRLGSGSQSPAYASPHVTGFTRTTRSGSLISIGVRRNVTYSYSENIRPSFTKDQTR